MGKKMMGSEGGGAGEKGGRGKHRSPTLTFLSYPIFTFYNPRDLQTLLPMDTKNSRPQFLPLLFLLFLLHFLRFLLHLLFFLLLHLHLGVS